MQLNTLLSLLKSKPSDIEFQEVMNLIESLYTYSPTDFTNGLGDDVVMNPAGSNEGSCKLFAFAQEQQFSQQQTLDCFGRYYRKDVLEHPENNDHGNIRNFMKYSWEGISFNSPPLKKK